MGEGPNLLFGLIRRHGRIVEPFERERLLAAAAGSVRGDLVVHERESALLGSIRVGLESGTPRVQSWHRRSLALGAGRLDHPSPLARALDSRSASAAGLVAEAFERWHESAFERLGGDWMLAAWDDERQRLTLARDRLGVGRLYYAADSSSFVFGPSLEVIAAMGLAGGLDEEFIARALVAQWSGDRTAYANTRTLMHGHSLTWDVSGVRLRPYAELRPAPLPQDQPREWYAEQLCQQIDRAVRLRVPENGRVALTLSGGLDSGGIGASLARTDLDLTAVTAFSTRPRGDLSAFSPPGRTANEWDEARAAAEFIGLDIVGVDEGPAGPVQSMRWAAASFHDPHVPGYHALDFRELKLAIQSHGCGMVFTGLRGNLTSSWRGSVLSQTLSHQLKAVGAIPWTRRWLGRRLPRAVMRRVDRSRIDPTWFRSCAVHPQLVDRFALVEQELRRDSLDPVAARISRITRVPPPGEAWARFGIGLLTPLADEELTAFTLGVPDWAYLDPATGMQRSLIREAMQGRLPEQIRLNQRRGLQGCGLVPSLRAVAGEVDEVLDELERGPSTEYVDLPHMRDAWTRIQQVDDVRSDRMARVILGHGIMAGLVVNDIIGA